MITDKLNSKPSSRLASLDIFRGMTVVFMIIVNTPGSWEYVYPPLRHAKWHGCTPTDLVFPFFLFIVGVSVWFSMQKYGNEINTASLLRIFRRMVTIFALGIFLTIFPYFLSKDYAHLRIMGVLQRIALAYAIGAILCLTVQRKFLWIVLLIILAGYWAAMAFFGGEDPYSLEDNFARQVDIAIIGADHLYKGFGVPFDPEGLFSTLPASANVILGYLAGGVLGKKPYSQSGAVKLLIVGAVLVSTGLLWSIFFPINKPLWTSSYVLFSSGIAMVLLAMIFWTADLKGYSAAGKFFTVPGTNALFSFFLAGIWTKTMLYLVKLQSGGEVVSLYNWIYREICVPVAGNMNGSLLFALMQVMIIWSFAYILYRNRIFIRL